jgi:uncharacterized protein YndB with AHSA1/START domain
MKKENELLITYEFDAPRELVFHAWKDPEHLKHWYAPDGCTIEFKSLDVKPGGTFHSCIHDPVHGECWIKGIYREVTPPEKLVMTMVLSNAQGGDVSAGNAGKPEDWPEAIVTTVTFEEQGGKTRLTLHQTVDENEAKKTGAYQSWFSMFEKLEGIVSKN